MSGLLDPISEFERALLSLDRLAAERILRTAAGSGTPLQVVDEVVVPALESIGAGWQQGTVALSQYYMSGRICEDLIDTILPPSGPGWKERPRMAIAVLQDYHTLGKRVVYSVLRSSGFCLLDYGRVDVDDVVRRVRDDGIEVLLLSVLMLPSALRVRDVREKLRGPGADVKIAVGGAPFRLDDHLWKEVGADAMGRHASEAVQIVRRLSGDLL